MKLRRLHTAQRLPLSLHEAWAFISAPGNLAAITPGWLDFEVASPVSERIHPGMIITYRIRPVVGLRRSWITEITHVNQPRFFVDEQRFGPFRFWHHQHRLRPVDGGVEMEDLVHYLMPYGPLGSLMHRLTIRDKLEGIFAHRRKVLEERFGPWQPIGMIA